MRAHDLFAGAGGWDLAARNLGIEAHGVENMKAATETRLAAGLHTVHDDVWTFGDYLDSGNDAEGLIASPPCQTFSRAGKGAGSKALDDVYRGIETGAYQSIDRLRGLGSFVGDERTALVLTPLHYAATREHYQWLAWEQVPTVLPAWEACAAELEQLGWHTWTGLVYAEQWGVPQTRKRALLLASKTGPVVLPTPTHSRYYSRSPERLDEGVQKWVSMAEALAPFGWPEDFVAVSNYGSGGDASKRGERDGSEPAATVTSKVDRNKFVFRSNAQAHATVRPETEPAPTITGGHDHGERVWEPLPEWCHRRPSTTVVGSFKPEIIAAPGYRTTVSRQNAEGSVRVTVAEAGVLQSFPADYPWQGAKGKQYLQVGNAVPPKMVEPYLAAITGLTSKECASE